MIEKEKTIINKLGLHARAASKLVSQASRFSSSISLSCKGKTADAKSIMTLLMLAAKQGDTISIRCNGKDEDEAMHAICSLIDNYFDEGQ